MYQGQVVIEGNLVRDPEKVLAGENGSIMARFSIAVNRYFKNAQAEPVEEVMFITIQAWGSLAKSCLQYLQKGRGVRVVGRLGRSDGNNKNKQESLPDEIPFDQEVAM